MQRLAIGLVLALASPARADFIMGPDHFIEERVRADPRDDGSERYLTLGLLTAPAGGWFGLRAQLDLVSFAGLSLGAAGTLFGRGDGTGITDATLRMTGVGFVAYTAPLGGRYKLRAQLGWGGELDVVPDTTTKMATTTRETLVEGAVQMIVRGNHDWSFAAGPIVQANGTTTVMLFAGLERRW